MFFNELPNNTSQQLPLIIVGFGFTPAESALFNIAKPLIGSALILVSAWMLYSTNLGTGYTCAISYIPCFVGGIIEVSIDTVPFTHKLITHSNSSLPHGPIKLRSLLGLRYLLSNLHISWASLGQARQRLATPRNLCSSPAALLLRPLQT